MFSLLFFSALLGFSYAAPTSSEFPEFLAFGPTIIRPNNQSVWTAGSPEVVQWETDNIPEAAQGYNLTIYLGYQTYNPYSENLDTKNPLASNISIMDGSATVKTLPNVTTGDNYIVVLMGTSGDASPPFTIHGLS